MMSRAYLLLAALLVLPACPQSSGGGGPDAGDGGPSIDGGTTQGLVFPFIMKPVLPATVNGNVVVTTVRLRLRSVRAIGDAASGDSRTFRSELELDWQAGDDNPDPLRFVDAPAGIYSSLDSNLDGAGDDSIVILGTVDVGGVPRPFTIEDHGVTPLAIDLNQIELKPGKTVTVPIEIKIDAIVGVVDWTQVRFDDGRFMLTSGPQLARVLAALPAAIHAQ